MRSQAARPKTWRTRLSLDLPARMLAALDTALAGAAANRDDEVLGEVTQGTIRAQLLRDRRSGEASVSIAHVNLAGFVGEITRLTLEEAREKRAQWLHDTSGLAQMIEALLAPSQSFAVSGALRVDDGTLGIELSMHGRRLDFLTLEEAVALRSKWVEIEQSCNEGNAPSEMLTGFIDQLEQIEVRPKQNPRPRRAVNIDDLLDKIRSGGMASLSNDERKRLMDASAQLGGEPGQQNTPAGPETPCA